MMNTSDAACLLPCSLFEELVVSALLVLDEFPKSLLKKPFAWTTTVEDLRR